MNGRSVLNLLGISDEDGSLEKERMVLFEGKKEKKEDEALQRIKWLMRIYRRWIGMKEAAQSGRFGFVEAVTVGMEGQYSFTELLADFQFILKNKNVLFEDEKTRAQSESECDAESCFILSRSQREKDSQNESGNALKEWFFGDGNSGNDDDDEDNIQNAVYLELLDSIHVFLDHTARISPDEIQTAMDKENKDDDGFDHFADAVCSVLEQKKKSSARFRRNKRSGVGNKFMTTNKSSHQQPATKPTTTKSADQETAQNIAIYQDAVYGNSTLLIQQQNQQEVDPKEQCFVEALCTEIEAESLEQKETATVAPIITSSIKTFVNDDDADSDAVIADLENVSDSNILEDVSSTKDATHSVWSVCQKFIAQTAGASDVYSSGWRYFYWNFYVNNKVQERVVFTTASGKSTVESNPGYRLKDWYVRAKHRDLKDEALNNRCCSLSLFQWKMVLKKAEIKLAEWRKNPRNRKLECNRSFWNHYGLEYRTPISIPHIVSLLLYTNYTKASYEFSKTFRKNSPFESDRLLKERHSEVAVWGRLLRETVECFGQQMSQRPDLKVFYHGVNREMIFPGTSIKLNGPVSTTLDFEIASGSFGAEGLVLAIKRTSGPFLWDCQWWSDFHEEAECLFLGGLEGFQIQSIRNIPSRTNYQRYIIPMNMLAKMLRGWQSLTRMATERDVVRLKELITEQIARKHALSLPSETDGYVLSLFDYFCVNVKKVVINMDWMRTDQWKNKWFGYRMFRPLFFENENDNSLKFQYFLEFLPNLQQFVVLYQESKPYLPSILVNKEFVLRLMEVMKFIDGHKSLRKTFVRFIVVTPILENGMDIDGMVEKYDEVIAVNGWKVEKMEYVDTERGGRKGEAICFKKL